MTNGTRAAKRLTNAHNDRTKAATRNTTNTRYMCKAKAITRTASQHTEQHLNQQDHATCWGASIRLQTQQEEGHDNLSPDECTSQARNEQNGTPFTNKAQAPGLRARRKRLACQHGPGGIAA